MMNTTGDWKEALNLIARMPRMMGLLFRIREGRGDDIPDDDLTLNMVQRLQTLDMEGVDDELMEQILSTYLVLHMDHGGGNLSTFTGGHCVRSCNRLCIHGRCHERTLRPLHGRANQSCLEFVLRIGTSDHDEVEAFVRNELAERRLCLGLGTLCSGQKIRGQPSGLPSVSVFARTTKISKSFAPFGKSLRVLAENKKISNPNAAIDIASGALLHHVGF